MPDHPRRGAAMQPATAAAALDLPTVDLPPLDVPPLDVPTLDLPTPDGDPAAGSGVLAELAAVLGDRPRLGSCERLARLRAAMDDGFQMVFQPIMALSPEVHPVGYEALSRFGHPPLRGPDVWLAEAEEFGMRAALELAAAEKAFAAVDLLPPDAFLTVNLSPQTLFARGFAPLMARAPLDRLVLEITEQRPIADYEAVQATLRPLRAAGMRLAVDDVGAGYASLKHILRLRPDFLKFDASLTRSVDTDPLLGSLITALAKFGRDSGSRVVAEGVETAAELDALHRIGIELAQGYYLGRPAPLGKAHH